MFEPYNDAIYKVALVYVHTGLKKCSNNRIYSVSATIFDNNSGIDTYESLISYEEYTSRDRYYSNISKEDIICAPSYDQVKVEIRQFLNKCNFVLVLDDNNNIEDILQLIGDKRIIDLCFACEFFLPEISSSRPKTIYEFIHNKERDKISFSAIEIVELSYNLISFIIENVLNDSMNMKSTAIRYYLKKSNTLFAQFFLSLARDYRSFFDKIINPYSSGDEQDWMKYLERAKPFFKKDENDNGNNDDKKKKKKQAKVKPKKIKELFETMANFGKGMKYREAQVEFALNVSKALNDGDILTIEAGTGTGKTQGYLIPVLEYLLKNKNDRVAISTYTKSLQEQIYQKELLLTKKIFKQYKDIEISVLKGKSSFLCAEKLYNIYPEEATGEQLLAWLYFVILIYNFRNCDLENPGQKIKQYLNKNNDISIIWNEISSRHGCNLKHNRCPAQIITSEASKARLIITNHHKLSLLDHNIILTDLFKIYIIDEANHFENAVRGALSIELFSKDILLTIKYIESIINNTLNRAHEKEAKKIINALNNIDLLKNSINEIFHVLNNISNDKKNRFINEIELTKPDTIIQFLSNMVIELSSIKNNLSFIDDSDICRMLKIQARSIQRMKSNLSLVNDYTEAVVRLLSDIKSDNNVISYSIFGKYWLISDQFVEVDQLINENFFEKKDCIIFTAATLIYEKSFDSFKNITGMNITPDRVFKFEHIPSPYSRKDFQIIVPDKAESGKYNNKENWTKYVISVVPELIKYNNGRTLVLFSSYTDLVQISDSVSKKLEQLNYPLLIQQKGISTSGLCDEFRAIKESVLFGVDTFWYGVDFKGDTLTQVIITRIPYPSPNNPIQMARKRLISNDEYWKRYRYDTFIKLKQGIGRLIRSETDKGKVYILDSRFKQLI